MAHPQSRKLAHYLYEEIQERNARSSRGLHGGTLDFGDWTFAGRLDLSAVIFAAPRELAA
jgi:hypothetical protein